VSKRPTLYLQTQNHKYAVHWKFKICKTAKLKSNQPLPTAIKFSQPKKPAFKKNSFYVSIFFNQYPIFHLIKNARLKQKN